MSVTELLHRSPLWGQPPLAVAAQVIVFLAALLVVVAVVLDFRAYHRQDRGVTRSDRSFVETGSMAAFFVGYYLVIRLRLGEIVLPGGVRVSAVLIGLALVVLGATFNVWGRLVLKGAWANQIKIYEGHELVTRGPFSMVRHPLYASLIWMAVGGSLIYANALSLAAVLAVFVPMMYVRARKEDRLLFASFGPAFEAYCRSTGMFMPRIRRDS